MTGWEAVSRPPTPAPVPKAQQSLKERLAAMEARHAGDQPLPAPAPPPDPDAPPPTEAEALATIQAAFPEATVVETVPRNG